MIIYHSHGSKEDLKRAKEFAPQYEHGAEFGRDMWLRKSKPYIIDNGAFSAHTNGHEWDSVELESMLEWSDNRDTDPDFVIVPDKLGDAEKTFERSSEWVDKIPFTTFQPIQDGMGIMETIAFAKDTGSSGIFIGGSMGWKRRNAKEIIEKAHKNGLKAHIGRPGGVRGILAAEGWGADSVDTASMIRNQSLDKLKRIRNQGRLSDF